MGAKKCPLCGAEMNYYEDGTFDTKEFGYCCSSCQVGYFSYIDIEKLKAIDLTKAENIVNPLQNEWNDFVKTKEKKKQKRVGDGECSAHGRAIDTECCECLKLLQRNY